VLNTILKQAAKLEGSGDPKNRETRKEDLTSQPGQKIQ
jgi:hypothetical protein